MWMSRQFLKYSFVALVIAVLSGCANVRWSHPTPSPELLQAAAKDIYGIYYEKEYTAKTVEMATQEAFDQIMHSKPDATTRGVMRVARLENGNLYIEGYSTKMYAIGLSFPEHYARYNIPDKPTLGYFYSYEGKITGVGFQTPHMIMSSDSRSSMVLRTSTQSPYKIRLHYQDNTSVDFDFLSTTISTRLGGGFKRNLRSSFDGLLSINYDIYSDTFAIEGPYNR